MNFRQLEYIIAVDKHRNFAVAADLCFVTQPTLSMMIHKLEDEVGMAIFNRKKHPVEPTKTGKLIIDQAKVILNESKKIQEIVHTSKNVIEGDLNIDVIPTLGVYLLPLFLNDFLKKYPQLKLKVEEKNTDEIVERIKKGWTDIGILATPLHEKFLLETPLFYEEIYFYTRISAQRSNFSAEDIEISELLMLEEGHCLRSQIVNFCKLSETSVNTFWYKSGSLETLKRLVEKNQGSTILPELATLDLSKENKQRLIRFRKPYPAREISIVSHTNYAKTRLIELLREEILNNLPSSIKENKPQQILEINKV